MTTQEHSLIVAGFGGQGVLTIGKLLCKSGLEEGKNATYLPSYGSEVRGGTANCHIKLSTGEIFSPVVEEADSLIILNQLSFDKFGNMVRDDGLLIYNESLVDSVQNDTYNSNARLLGIPATAQAAEMGNVIVANIIMLGAFVEKTNICKQPAVKSSIENWLAKSNKATLELNIEAFEAGMEMAASEKR